MSVNFILYMNRARSSSSLTKLALSIKNSIDKYQNSKKQTYYQPLQTFQNKHNNIKHSNNNKLKIYTVQKQQQQIKDNTTKKCQFSTQRQQIIRNKRLKLQKEINTQSQIIQQPHNIQKQYQQQYSKQPQQNNENNPQKQLQLHSYNIQKIQQLSKLIKNQQFNKYALVNKLNMLKEDIRSHQHNINQNISERQYYQNIIYTYKNQYQKQSQLILTKWQIQKQCNQILQKISKNQQKIIKVSQSVNQNKNNREHKKIQIKVKQYRLQLIQIQSKADLIASSYAFKKIRYQICLFIKKYMLQKLQVTKMSQINDFGIQLYLCKQQIVDDLTKFLLKNNIKNTQYYEIIKQYCLCLKNLQKNYIIYCSQQQMKKQGGQILLSRLINQNKQYQQRIKQKQHKIRQLNQKLNIVLGNQSMLNISVYTDKQPKLSQIQYTLKQVQKQQSNRINKICQYLQKMHRLTISQHQQCNIEMKTLLLEQIKKYQQLVTHKRVQIDKLHKQYAFYQHQKQRIQEKISKIVQNWKQISQKNKKIKESNFEVEIINKNRRVKNTLTDRNTQNMINQNNMVISNNCIHNRNKTSNINTISITKDIPSTTYNKISNNNFSQNIISKRIHLEKENINLFTQQSKKAITSTKCTKINILLPSHSSSALQVMNKKDNKIEKISLTNLIISKLIK